MGLKGFKPTHPKRGQDNKIQEQKKLQYIRVQAQAFEWAHCKIWT